MDRCKSPYFPTDALIVRSCCCKVFTLAEK
jgi:hypothetical protein